MEPWRVFMPVAKIFHLYEEKNPSLDPDPDPHQSERSDLRFKVKGQIRIWDSQHWIVTQNLYYSTGIPWIMTRNLLSINVEYMYVLVEYTRKAIHFCQSKCLLMYSNSRSALRCTGWNVMINTYINIVPRIWTASIRITSVNFYVLKNRKSMLYPIHFMFSS